MTKHEAVLEEAAEMLADVAAHACIEPRAFHANEGRMQQTLSNAVARVRLALKEVRDERGE